MLKLSLHGEEIVFIDGIIESSTSSAIKRKFLKIGKGKYESDWGDLTIYSFIFPEDIFRAAKLIDPDFKIIESDEESIKELEELRQSL